MGHSLEDYIYSLSLYALIKEKIEALWVGEDPATVAYYKLNGDPIVNGILKVNMIKIRNDWWGTRFTANILIDLRKELPEVTKEELIDMLKESIDG